MKKNYSIVSLVQAFIIVSVLLFSGTTHSQDLTDAQKLERCQNNKKRIADLEAQLEIIIAELSQTMETKEMEDARTEMVLVREVKNTFKSTIQSWGTDESVDRGILGVSDENWEKLYRIEVHYNMLPCVGLKDEKLHLLNKRLDCATELEKIITNKITKAKSLDRLALLAKKNEIEKH